MIGLVTITDNYNLGNRLQNFAAYKILSQYDNVQNIPNFYYSENKTRYDVYFQQLKENIQSLLPISKYRRIKSFLRFNRLTKKSKYFFYRKTNFLKLNGYFDTFVTGSDQVWNPSFKGLSMYFTMLGFVTNKEHKVALAPSIGVSSLSKDDKEVFHRYLSDFSFLSCREEQGSNLVEEITGKDCVTLIDPTLMLSKEEWRMVSCKPKFHKENKKYILLYFLGNISEEYMSAINTISRATGLEIIDIFDRKSIYYSCGPSEFLYMIDHASLVLTDSFHGSVFSYIFDKPLKIFERKDGLQNMNSRLENLIHVLKFPKGILMDFNHIDFEYVLDKPKYDKSALDIEKRKVYQYLDKAVGKRK